MNPVVYTAIFGGYNELKTHPDIPGVDWVAFTDTPMDRDDWDIRVRSASRVRSAPPSKPIRPTPRREAKWFKLLPHVVLYEYDLTIWIDGTVRVDSPRFVDEALACIGGSGIALWAHPERMDVYTEAVASMSMPKYADEPLLDQVDAYAGRGYPIDGGLWACGILARDSTNDAMRQLMWRWLDEIDRWSVQDQLSFPYALWRGGMTPGEFPAGLYDNPWLTVTGHNPDR